MSGNEPKLLAQGRLLRPWGINVAKEKGKHFPSVAFRWGGEFMEPQQLFEVPFLQEEAPFIRLLGQLSL